MIEAGIIIPHAAVGIHKGRLPGTVDESDCFIHELVTLIAVEQQIKNLTNPVLVIRIERRVLRNLRFKIMIAIAIHVVGKGQIKIPWEHLELSRFRVVVVVVVFAVGDIVVMNGFHHRAITEILFDIEIGTPPLLTGTAPTITTDKGGNIGTVSHLRRTLIIGISRMPLDFVKITIRKVMLFKKLTIHLLDNQIESIVVTPILRTRRPRLVDDIKLRVVRLTGLYSTELEKTESYSLEKTLLTPMLKIDLLND